MSKQLDELLLLMRQHDAFPELLKAMECPEPRPYSPAKGVTFAEQQADWIFRSGRKSQDLLWRAFLTETASPEA